MNSNMTNNQRDIIIITATSGTSSWIRETLSPSSWVRMFGESLIGGYKEKMNSLRHIDSGIAIWLKDLDGMVKEMRQAAKNSRYIDVAILLSKLDKRLTAVREAGKEIKQLTDEEILPFELEHKKELPGGQLFNADDGLSSEAGAFDDMKRRWVAQRLETQMREQRKIAINSLIDKASQLVNNIKDKYNDLGKARASGNIKAYVDTLASVAVAQREFQNDFTPIYRKYLHPLVERAQEERKKLQEEEAKKTEIKELVSKEFENPEKETVIAPQTSKDLTPEQTWKNAPGVSDWILNQKQPEKPVIPIVTEPAITKAKKQKKSKAPEEVKPIVESTPTATAVEQPKVAELNSIIFKNSNANFISELIKESRSDDPYILSAMLIKYAETIEEIDLEKSLKLLAIAEGILGE